jgi:hypothetical protein
MPDGSYEDHPGYRSLCLRDRESGDIGDPVSIVRDTYGIVTNRSAALLLAALVRSNDLKPAVQVHETNGHAVVLMNAPGPTISGSQGQMGTGISVQTTHDGSGQLKALYHVNHLKADGSLDFTANLTLTKWSHRHSRGVVDHIQAGRELVAEAAGLTAAYESTLVDAAATKVDLPMADQILQSAFRTNALDMSPKEGARHAALLGAWQATDRTALDLFATICRYQDRESSYRGSNRMQSQMVGVRADVKKRALDAVRACLKDTKDRPASTQDTDQVL